MDDVAVSPGDQQKKEIDFWIEFLNKQAAEMGLESKVKVVMSRYGGGVVIYAYEAGDGQMVDLGWCVEDAMVSLRDMAGGG